AIKEGLDSLCHAATTTSALSTIDACNMIESLRLCGRAQFESDSALPPDIDVRWDWQYEDDAAEKGFDGPRETIDSAAARCMEQIIKDQNLDGGEPDVTGPVLESLAESADEDVQSALNRGGDLLRS